VSTVSETRDVRDEAKALPSYTYSGAGLLLCRLLVPPVRPTSAWGVLSPTLLSDSYRALVPLNYPGLKLWKDPSTA